ncbi:hypothetical protein [Maribellus sp. YY47]|uniref:V-type ATP synthase subunit I n=1 Tax=Maribellus sp. YY47 TaxID=2929486 RepID=UPI002000628A|nr:hypothetical protein [Maribellus sp. YY47]MCK3683097.1 hypothetical protein [Maribellus sp. YY47]
MKKLLLFMAGPDGEVDANLSVLGQLGVLHVTPFQTPKDSSIERVDARIGQLRKAISILDKDDDQQSASADFVDYRTIDRGEIVLMDKVLELDKKCAQLEKRKAELNAALASYANWGQVSAGDIDELRQAGVFVKLYLLSEQELKNINKRDDIHIVGKINNLTQAVLVSTDSDNRLNCTEVSLPQAELHELRSDLAKAIDGHRECENQLTQLCAQKSLLQEALDERIRRLNVRNIQYSGVSIDKQLRCWKGFIPEDAVEKLIKEAEKNSWGYIIEEPSAEETDEVPTLLRTSRWVERIRPVMNFMGLVPGYKELDVSLVFMIFFTFFTGILVGDAGYGLIFLVITFFVHRKTGFARKTEFQLMYTLSASILFWGILTGTYFGAESIANISFLNKLKVEKLASFGGDNVFVQKFMFLVGAIHLTIGHLQVAWRYSNSVKAMGQQGWVAIIWGLYLVVNQMLLGIAAPGIMSWLFIGGILLVGLFSNPGASFLKGMLSSLGNLPLSIINGFSDIISYIRLYAVGLSTVLMASSFNQMAIGDGITTLVSGIGAALILFLGHGLNMVLAAMAVLVHGVRLNMLEYAGHAGVEFSGNEYKPFKLTKQ